MAGGPYKDKYDNYYLTWTASRLHPSRRSINETLRTKKKPEASTRKFRRAELYGIDKHDPCITNLYNNPSIKPFTTDSLTSGDINSSTSDYAPIPLEQGAHEYKAYQINRPIGWQSELTQRVYSADVDKFVT